MQAPLVSIIIPTFNRAHLINETLDSVIAQTYTNWECIIVDDGSTDNTDEVLKMYCNRDDRIQYHHRPKDRLPGGNAARNYGLELSKGEFIQWFDSDDLMHKEKLNFKINTLLKNNDDFVISKTKNFGINKAIKYDFKSEDVNFESYALGLLHWLTPDLCVKRDISEYIRFNEHMKAGQEYNYNCKLLLISNKMSFIDKVLVHRRYHNDSIQGARDLNLINNLKIKFNIYWINFLDINSFVKNKKFNQYSLLKCVSSYLESQNSIQLPKYFWLELFKNFKLKTIYIFLAFLSNFLFGKYFFFYKYLKKY